MSEVKRYHRDDDEFERYECEFVVDAKDFDRVTAERDAALAENKLLRHDVASYLETVAKVCDILGVDLESAKTAEGKPSDVLFGYVSLMQQRLTAADERADVLEGRKGDLEISLMWVRSQLTDAVIIRFIDIALKPAEPDKDEHVCTGCGSKGWTANCKECVPY